MVQIASKAFHGHRGIQIATQRQNLKGNEAILEMSPAGLRHASNRSLPACRSV